MEEKQKQNPGWCFITGEQTQTPVCVCVCVRVYTIDQNEIVHFSAQIETSVEL